jgi:hypothetical protein
MEMKSSHWKWIIVTICGVWLLLMVGASYLSYFHKSPVRIENWKPERVIP